PPLPSSYFADAYPHLLVLPSFPTRRSSDLAEGRELAPGLLRLAIEPGLRGLVVREELRQVLVELHVVRDDRGHRRRHRLGQVARSEEHTSELQSRENLVCRLLLEKKKTDHT